MFDNRPDYNPEAPAMVEYQILEKGKYIDSIKTNDHKRLNDEKTNDNNTNKKLKTDETTIEYLITQPWPQEPKYLYSLNSHPNDVKIKFHDKTHKYFISYPNESNYTSEFVISASGLYKQYFPEFDKKGMIKKIVDKWKRENDPQYKYFGMEHAQIDKDWEDNGKKASQQGTFVHLLFECSCNKALNLYDCKYTPLSPVQQYLKWRNNYFDKYFEEFRTEFRFHTGPDLRLVGTADLIAIRKNHPLPQDCNGILTLQIFDWKCSKKLFDAILKQQQEKICPLPECTYRLCQDNPEVHHTFQAPCELKHCCRGMCPNKEFHGRQYEKETGFGPCRNLNNNDYAHYVVQQNIYKWFLETYYGSWTYKGHKYTSVQVEFMCLVVVHPTNPKDEAMMIKVQPHPEIIQEMIEIRRKQVQDYISTKTEPFIEDMEAFQLAV